MQSEFSRAAVATLIAAVIGSALDPADVSLAPHPPLQQRPGEAPPDALARLANLLIHFDRRVAEIAETQPPGSLLDEYHDIRWMLQEIAKHQSLFAWAPDQAH